MKVRQGFVSNSSSSSFLIYGSSVKESMYEDLKLHKMLKAYHKETGVDIPYIYAYEWEKYYIGPSYSEIGDNETGLQFKNGIERMLKKFSLWVQENYPTVGSHIMKEIDENMGVHEGEYQC